LCHELGEQRFVTKIAEAVIEGRAAFEQTQLAGEKVEGGEGGEAAENVEYVDTSAYESYEKQEGDFVETPEATEAVEQPVQAEGESES